MRPTLAPLLILLLICFATPCFGQNPAAYSHVSNWTNFAEFVVTEPVREVVHEKGVTFEVTEEVSMNFQVLVAANGTVKFVRPPRCDSKYNEFRLGGTDALYGFRFSALEPESPDQWIGVAMHLYPDGATRQAQ